MTRLIRWARLMAPLGFIALVLVVLSQVSTDRDPRLWRFLVMMFFILLNTWLVIYNVRAHHRVLIEQRKARIEDDRRWEEMKQDSNRRNADLVELRAETDRIAEEVRTAAKAEAARVRTDDEARVQQLTASFRAMLDGYSGQRVEDKVEAVRVIAEEVKGIVSNTNEKVTSTSEALTALKDGGGDAEHTN